MRGYRQEAGQEREGRYALCLSARAPTRFVRAEGRPGACTEHTMERTAPSGLSEVASWLATSCERRGRPADQATVRWPDLQVSRPWITTRGHA
jgi:hypothetical protein